MGRADRSIRLRTIGCGLHILYDLPKRRRIVDPVQHSFAANEAETLRIDAELLQHPVKLLKSLLRRGCAGRACRRCSRLRAGSGCCNRRLICGGGLRS